MTQEREPRPLQAGVGDAPGCVGESAAGERLSAGLLRVSADAACSTGCAGQELAWPLSAHTPGRPTPQTLSPTLFSPSPFPSLAFLFPPLSFLSFPVLLSLHSCLPLACPLPLVTGHSRAFHPSFPSSLCLSLPLSLSGLGDQGWSPRASVVHSQTGHPLICQSGRGSSSRSGPLPPSGPDAQIEHHLLHLCR